MAAGAVLIFVVLFFIPVTISQRLVSSFNFKEGSNAERLKNWWQAADVIQNYPLRGVGLGKLCPHHRSDCGRAIFDLCPQFVSRYRGGNRNLERIVIFVL